jgi:hypothetical protein
MRRVTRLALGCLLLACVAAGQTPSRVSQVMETFRAMSAGDRGVACSDRNAVPSHPGAKAFCNSLLEVLTPGSNATSFAVSALKQSPLFWQVLQAEAERRIDLQNGAGPQSQGSTSAVERAGISDVLGLALENGAITQSTSGSSLTLQGNLLGLSRFLAGQDVFPPCGKETGCLTRVESVLNSFSGSATLNVSSPSTQSASGTLAESNAAVVATMQKSASHLTGFTVKYQLYNRLNLRSKLYVDAWKTATSDAGLLKQAEAEQLALQKAFDFGGLLGKQAYEQWLTDSEAKIQEALGAQSEMPDDRMTALIAERYDVLLALAIEKGYDVGNLTAFLKSTRVFQAARAMALENARSKTASGVTLEYAFSRPTNQPRISTLRLAYTLRPGSGGNDGAVSLNAGADLYNKPPVGTGTLRDLQAGLQIDRHFGDQTIATLAFYGQWQIEKAALTIGQGDLAPGTQIALPGPAAVLLAPAGRIWVAQAKTTFSLKNGVRLPVGVTWSNRTELIKAKEVRGHVGFDFDWSSLLLGKKTN